MNISRTALELVESLNSFNLQHFRQKTLLGHDASKRPKKKRKKVDNRDNQQLKITIDEHTSN